MKEKIPQNVQDWCDGITDWRSDIEKVIRAGYKYYYYSKDQKVLEDMFKRNRNYCSNMSANDADQYFSKIFTAITGVKI